MMKAPVKIGVLVVGAVAALAALRYKPWHHGRGGGAGELEVGYLPVTCHLTCPVTDFATQTTKTGTRFVSHRFMDFPTVVDALKANRIQATFLLAPLAM